MKSLLADLDILMGVAGFNGVGDFDRSILGKFTFAFSAWLLILYWDGC
jgi:hypothetical protein